MVSLCCLVGVRCASGGRNGTDCAPQAFANHKSHPPEVPQSYLQSSTLLERTQPEWGSAAFLTYLLELVVATS
jgi:hypothetical protein